MLSLREINCAKKLLKNVFECLKFSAILITFKFHQYLSHVNKQNSVSLLSAKLFYQTMHVMRFRSQETHINTVTNNYNP